MGEAPAEPEIEVEIEPEEPQAMIESPGSDTKKTVRKKPTNQRRDGILSVDMFYQVVQGQTRQ